MTNARGLFRDARQRGFAMGAFNVSNLETLMAVVRAAGKLKSAVIVEASDGEVGFVGKEQLAALARIYERQSGARIVLNLDHAPTKESVFEAVDLGFDCVHFDGSKLPLEENLRITREVVSYAGRKGVLVEAEFDPISGSSADHRRESLISYQDVSKYTDPFKARQFAEETGVDTLAVFIGNAHGLYREPKKIDIGQLAKIHREIPNTFLSLHGGSGIPAEDIKSAIQSGIVKINVNTELRLAYRDALKQVLSASAEIAPYKLMVPVIENLQKVVESKITLFGSAGKAREWLY